MSLCPYCPAIFGSDETLAQHVGSIHGGSSKADDEPAPAPVAEEDLVGRDDNLELEPLIQVLSSEQKDLLIVRALQRDRSMIDTLVAFALEPLTDEGASSRAEELEPAALVSTVNAYSAAGARPNALMLLRASTEIVLEALGDLAETLPETGAGGSSIDGEPSAELQARERRSHPH